MDHAQVFCMTLVIHYWQNIFTNITKNFIGSCVVFKKFDLLWIWFKMAPVIPYATMIFDCRLSGDWLLQFSEPIFILLDCMRHWWKPTKLKDKNRLWNGNNRWPENQTSFLLPTSDTGSNSNSAWNVSSAVGRTIVIFVLQLVFWRTSTLNVFDISFTDRSLWLVQKIFLLWPERRAQSVKT